jgi:hypothetical protein
VLAGYTYSRETRDLVSLESPNDARVNADGISGGRRHNFKVSGSATLPYRLTFGANLLLQSGQPITRTVSIPGCTGAITTGCVSQGSVTVNAEPRGTVELPGRLQTDVRIGRLFNLAGRKFELGVDAYNLTNANTVYTVRTGTGRTNVRYANDPAQPVTTIPTFMSPTAALGPRIIRLNFTYWFGPGSSAAANR